MALTAGLFVVAGCAGGSGDSGVSGPASYGEITYATYVEGENVRVMSDCPNTDQTLQGNPDGLPHIGSTTEREAIEAWLGNPEDSRIIPRNGEVWERDADGSIQVTQVEDWMIEVTVDEIGSCPGAPTSINGVPVIFRLAVK